ALGARSLLARPHGAAGWADVPRRVLAPRSLPRRAGVAPRPLRSTRYGAARRAVVRDGGREVARGARLPATRCTRAGARVRERARRRRTRRPPPRRIGRGAGPLPALPT